jgi:hypothetical protein
MGRILLVPLIAVAVLVVVLLMISTSYCFRIFSLTFDHVVIADAGLLKVDATTGSLVAPDPKPTLGEITNVMAGYGPYGAASSSTHPKQVGSLTDYEERFFDITIKRQKFLKSASCYAKGAGILVVVSFLYFAGSLIAGVLLG